jgi:hypothetical protein
MIVTFTDALPCKVWWRHRLIHNDPIDHDALTGRLTEVYIAIVLDGVQLEGCDKVICHFRTPYNRNTGRKRALAKLLARLYPGPQFKRRRQAFWEAYRTQLGHW